MKSKILASAALVLTLVYISCNKPDATDLGNELIPAVDNVNTFDTILDVISDNILAVDTTSMVYNQYHTVGIIENDAEFGSTSAHFYSSFAPSSSHNYPFVKRDTVKIDSVVLSLAYGAVYGDSGSIQTIEVREINPHFEFKDSAYKINGPDLPVESALIGSRAILFSTLNDPVQYKNQGSDTVSTANELRIKLDTAWARRFVGYDTSYPNAYYSDSTFLRAFRGFEIRASDASAGKRALAYFDLSVNDRTRITFYCRIQNGGRADTISPFFVYKAGYPEANMVRRTPMNAYLANVNNGVENDEKIYLQSTPGSYVDIQIPGLTALDNRVIHRAELIMDQAPSAEEKLYLPPPKLFIEAVSANKDSVLTIRNDFVLTNSSPGYDINSLGGVYNKNAYAFNLTRYVQSIVTKKQRHFTLRVGSPFTTRPYYVSSLDVPSNAFVAPLLVNPLLAGGRVVLYGGAYADTTKRMRLRIIYSKI